MALAEFMMWGISIQTWNSVIFWATITAAVAGGVGVISGFVAGVVGYKVSDVIQKETSLQLAQANARAESARQASAEANARAAEANRKAEEERLARVKIEQRLAPRELLPETADKVDELFKPTKSVAMIIGFGDSPEIVRFAHQLETAVARAGSRAWVSGAMGGAGFTGVLISGARGNEQMQRLAAAFAALLREAGFEASVYEPFDPADGNSLPAMVGPAGAPSASESSIRIFVGAK